MICAPIGHNQLRAASSIKVNAARLSTAISPKFGASCLYLNGSVGGPAIALDVISPGTGDFTFEFWVYTPAIQTAQNSVIEQPKEGLTINFDNSNRVGCGQSYAGGRSLVYPTAIPINQWVSIAVTRQSNSMAIYVNGTMSGPLAYSTDLTQNTYTGTYIGSSVGNGGFTGYIDELRISNIARYTASYTPASAPFSDDINTLLLCHFDNYNISTTGITDDNT